MIRRISYPCSLCLIRAQNIPPNSGKVPVMSIPILSDHIQVSIPDNMLAKGLSDGLFAAVNMKLCVDILEM